jgi:hypothetical protein
MFKTKPVQPKIVCLCGSTRFYREFQQANYDETFKGNIVLSVGFYPHAQKQAHGENVGCTPELKTKLDLLHLRKIDLADEIFVLNVGGYVGDSTANEIAYVLSQGKIIRWIEPTNGEKTLQTRSHEFGQRMASFL